MLAVMQIPKDFFKFSRKINFNFSKDSSKNLICIFDLEDKIDLNMHIKNVYTYMIYFALSTLIVEKFNSYDVTTHQDLRISAFRYIRLFNDNNFDFTKTIEEIDYAVHSHDNSKTKNIFMVFKEHCSEIKLINLIRFQSSKNPIIEDEDTIENFMEQSNINELLFVNFLSSNVKYYKF
jgi:hypothetical protein